ncbi:MAG: hypothetical protein ABFS86_16095 [Planctomycetota bacterium]
MLTSVESLLRSKGRFSIDASRVPWLALGGLVCLAGFAYGTAMGFSDARPLQSLYSGLKVPMLFVLTSVVCLPNFFVVNTLLGLRNDFTSAFRGIVAAQATGAVCLASLAPFTLFIYVSSDDYNFALVFNGGMFLLATVAAQLTLSKHYAPLIAANPRHRNGRTAWAILYVFVAIQLAWILRPFVGSPGLPTRFFREEAWDNAYVVVAQRVWALLTGG